jgi:hypothetical protein
MPLSVKQGLRFNGYEYVGIPFQLPDKGKIKLKYNPSSFYDYNTLFDNSANNDVWELWIYGSGLLAFRAGSGGTNGYATYTLPSINSFYEIEVTWDKATTEYSLYVDGVLRSSKTGMNWSDAGTHVYLAGGNTLNTKGKGIMTYFSIYDANDNLVANYPLNEGHGTTAYDTVGNNHGTIYEATWVVKSAPKGLVLDGKDDYVGIPYETIESDQITLETWAMPYVFTAGTHDMTISPAINTYVSFLAKKPFASIYVNGAQKTVNSNEAVQARKWYYITATYDGSSLKIYVNRVYKAQLTGLSGKCLLADSNGRIGQFSGNGLFFDGILGAQRIYNRALSADEIAENYKGNVTRNGLVGEWLLDGMSGTVAKDTAGNNDGTIYGATWLKKQTTNVKTPSRVLTALR